MRLTERKHIFQPPLSTLLSTGGAAKGIEQLHGPRPKTVFIVVAKKHLLPIDIIFKML
jgi:hypothetical protein